MKEFPANSPDEFNKLSKEEQDILLNWCLKLDKTQSFNTKHSSYNLKGMFEKSNVGFYIYNGAFKGAMVKAGFSYKLVNSDSPNWYFNVSEKSIKLI